MGEFYEHAQQLKHVWLVAAADGSAESLQI